MKTHKPKTFIFDFDATIFPGETLDEIIIHVLKSDAQATIKSAEIIKIGHQGMSGSISMEDSLKKRLAIASPTQRDILTYVALNYKRIAKEMQQLLTDLQNVGHKVLVISGGFEEWIIPLLKGIVPANHIHANRLKDSRQALLYSNIIRRDKEEIIKELIQQDTISTNNIIMIGDGATDFSVFESGIAGAFIGTFYYVKREKRLALINKIKESGQIYFTELTSFVAHIRKLLS